MEDRKRKSTTLVEEHTWSQRCEPILTSTRYLAAQTSVIMISLIMLTVAPKPENIDGSGSSYLPCWLTFACLINVFFLVETVLHFAVLGLKRVTQKHKDIWYEVTLQIVFVAAIVNFIDQNPH